MKTGPKPIPVRDRILENVIADPITDCWIWRGFRNAKGYGVIGIGSRSDGTRKRIIVSRAVWIEFNGEIPDGMFVCHRCDTPACCNPAHLFLGTQKDNMADAARKGRCRNPFNSAKTSCPKGHPYDFTVIQDGRSGRRCRACAREATRRHYWRNKSKQQSTQETI